MKRDLLNLCCPPQDVLERLFASGVCVHVCMYVQMCACALHIRCACEYIQIYYILIRLDVFGGICVLHHKTSNCKWYLRHTCVRIYTGYYTLIRFDVFGGMGWLQVVGSIKLQVSFAEYRLFCRALVQKRPIILLILLTEATPYLCSHS